MGRPPIFLKWRFPYCTLSQEEQAQAWIIGEWTVVETRTGYPDNYHTEPPYQTQTLIFEESGQGILIRDGVIQPLSYRIGQ